MKNKAYLTTGQRHPSLFGRFAFLLVTGNPLEYFKNYMTNIAQSRFYLKKAEQFEKKHNTLFIKKKFQLSKPLVKKEKKSILLIYRH